MLVRGLTTPDAVHSVEVGCGYIVPVPLALPDSGEPTRQHHGALVVELRREGGVVGRYHTAAGRRSRFWALDPRPVELEAVAQAVRPAYEGYDRLRVVVAREPGLRLLTFKDDLLLEETANGALRQRRFPDEAARREALRARLPWLDEDLIRRGLARAGWRQGDFHGRG